MIKNLLIDMDDTLYSEFDYVKSGFHAVACYIHDKMNTDKTADQLTSEMLAILKKYGRGKVFNKVLEQNNLSADTKVISSLVTCYRNHEPNIQLDNAVYNLLTYLKGRYRLILVTDGLPLMQINKTSALELDQIIDDIYYTWNYAKKPHVDSYGHPIDDLRLNKDECLIIGDNPINDGQPAAKLQIPFWQIHSEHQTRAPYADKLFMSFTDIGPALEEL